jgi:signal transduction histidine kinase
VPSAAAPDRTVLFLTSGDPTQPANIVLREAIASVLRDGPEPIEIRSEAIETQRFDGDAEFDRRLAALFKIKYTPASPALIITTAEPALAFARRHRAELFPDVPIVFGMVDQKGFNPGPLGPDITGVFARFDASATLDAALKLHPRTRKIVVVSGVLRFDRQLLTSVRSELRPFESRLSFRYLTDQPFKDVLAELAALGDDAIVFYVSMVRDGDGVPRVSRDVLEILRRTTPVPIYGLFDGYLGYGITGGVLLDFQRHGTEVGRLATRILSGVRPADLPPTTTANLTAFDWRELKRFGVDEAWLPAGSIVVHREVGLWDLYRRTILTVAAVLAAQSLLIGALLVQRRTRQRAELALHDLSGRLLSAQEDERRRIARDLHDNVSQRVALLAIGIEQLAMTGGGSEAAREDSLRALGERTAEISTEIHNLSHGLHSAKLDALGLTAAVRGHCRELVAQGLTVHFREQNVPASVPYNIALCLFRIAQEGLNNVVKHSGAHEADVTLSAAGDVLLLSVSDAGAGFHPTARHDRAGLGLVSMRERLRLIGGELEISSAAGRGTRIAARVPVRDAAGRGSG